MKQEERDLVLLKELLDLLDLTIARAPKDEDTFLADLDKRVKPFVRKAGSS